MTAMTQDPDVRLQQSRQQAKDDNALAGVVGTVDKVTPTGSGDKRPASVIWLTDLAATLECHARKPNANPLLANVLMQVARQCENEAKALLHPVTPVETPVPTNPRRMGGQEPNPTRPTVAELDAPQFWPHWALRARAEWDHEKTELKKRIAEMENAIMAESRIERNERETAMQLYHGGEHALELVTRQIALSPKFKDLTPADHQFVAATCLLHGISPEFGIHAWYGKKWDKVKKDWVNGDLNLCIDYKGLISSSLPNISKRRAIKSRRLSPEEMRERGIPELDIKEGAIAYVVELWEVDTMLAFQQAGQTYEPYRGYGWAGKFRNKGKKKDDGSYDRELQDVPNGRDLAWLAEKRAWRALYAQVADLRPLFVREMEQRTGTQVRIVEDDHIVVDTTSRTAETVAPFGTVEGIELVDIEDGEIIAPTQDATPAPTEPPSAEETQSGQPPADEPAPTKATYDEIKNAVMAWKEARGIAVVSEAFQEAAKAVGLRSVHAWQGTLADLNAKLDAYQQPAPQPEQTPVQPTLLDAPEAKTPVAYD